MTNIVAWIAIGLTCALAGAWFLTWETTPSDVAGWLLIGVGGLLAQVGVIACGVWVALQERDRA